MDKTNVIATSSDLTGNVGQCTINSTNISVSSFYARTIAVDSCSGKTVSDSGVYYDWSYVYIPLAIAITIGGIIGIVAWFASR